MTQKCSAGCQSSTFLKVGKGDIAFLPCGDSLPGDPRHFLSTGQGMRCMGFPTRNNKLDSQEG